MNKKGFTLVEIIIVIALIALITIIAVPSSIAVSNKIKGNMLNNQISLIESAAETYGNDHLNSIKNSSQKCNENNNVITIGSTFPCIKITVQNLLNESYLKGDAKSNDEEIVSNPINNSSLNNNNIYVYYQNNRIYAYFVK